MRRLGKGLIGAAPPAKVFAAMATWPLDFSLRFGPTQPAGLGAGSHSAAQKSTSAEAPFGTGLHFVGSLSIVAALRALMTQ
jgi:hypothetical protein